MRARARVPELVGAAHHRGMRSKLWSGGGDDTVHSSVPTSHRLGRRRAPAQAVEEVHHEEELRSPSASRNVVQRFSGASAAGTRDRTGRRAGAACPAATASWPMNSALMITNDSQKCSLPSRSLIIRPKISGNQKWIAANDAKQHRRRHDQVEVPDDEDGVVQVDVVESRPGRGR